MTEFERDVREALYTAFAKGTGTPSADTLAVTLCARRPLVTAALRALAEAHAIVLQPDGESIRMAHPFSGVPTDFAVTVGARHWFANCVWDGLAIIALFGGTGTLRTHSPSGTPVRWEVLNGRVFAEGFAHFVVPAARFWEDIGYT